jgi:hypothetical protein
MVRIRAAGKGSKICFLAAAKVDWIQRIRLNSLNSGFLPRNTPNTRKGVAGAKFLRR